MNESISDDDNDDVIELNVGGEKITTLRSTLTIIPKSRLAQMFSKNDHNQSYVHDKDGNVFFDYSPVQFKYLLDQLRMMKYKPEIAADELNFQAPTADIRTNFSYMITELGLNRKYNVFFYNDFILRRTGVLLF